MTRLAILFALPFLALSLRPVTAPAADERAAVERAVKDYVEGIYEARPELIERGVHPALVKRGTYRPEGSDEYGIPGIMTYEQLVDLARRWNEGGAQGTDLGYTIEIHEVLDRTASAFLSAKWGVDHIQLIKTDGQWKIIHVLWQSHPPKENGR